jgi:hypothetical protein
MFGGKARYEEREKEREKAYKHKNGGISIKCACKSYIRLMMSTEDEKSKAPIAWRGHCGSLCSRHA